ncbi:MAG TPA: DUF4168 domain-containing protein [Desulfosalsimonadaceae bacterium]|nr:DUF4168 domain-containing protein [Desulfosalsimonadaceae bacterium]
MIKHDPNCTAAADHPVESALGQQGQQQYQYPDPQQQQQPADFNQENLQKFAEAQTDVSEIRGEYSDALSDVEDANKARELQEKYTQKMIDAIEENNLSVSKYNEISRAVQDNPSLKEKVDDIK